MRFTLATVSCRLTGLALLLGCYAPVRAESAQGLMFVSVTIVATCEVSAQLQTVANVSCPQDNPYRVSLGPTAIGQMSATGHKGTPFLAGKQQVQLSRLAAEGLPAASAPVHADTATSIIANVIMALTISY